MGGREKRRKEEGILKKELMTKKNGNTIEPLQIGKARWIEGRRKKTGGDKKGILMLCTCTNFT